MKVPYHVRDKPAGDVQTAHQPENVKRRFKMKNGRKLLCLLLAVMMLCSMATIAHAAPVAEATIDPTKTGSMTIYKFDLTNAEKDGIWDSSYVSTGVYDQSVNDILGGTIRHGDDDASSDLGNSQTSSGYAIKGVEFTYLKVADIVQFTESALDNQTQDHVEVLYGIDKTRGADFLTALGLTANDRYANADHLNSAQYFYQSDVLIDALRDSLEANATTVKNALENYVRSNGGTALPLTDENGLTSASSLPLGLYLVVETKVPEMVVDTTNPFLVSLPMTSVDGGNAADGGTRWIYDVTLYPKNLTGIPSLEKTLREASTDTGKNNGLTDDITDGYAHTGTASDGDVIEYQLISTLPSITSEATYLAEYTFLDTLSKGLSYNRNDVIVEFFTDKACTDRIAHWTEADSPAKFTVNYTANGTTGESTMTVRMTDEGLAEINSSKAVYSGAGMVNSGYSDCTVRITYAATMHSDNSVVYGDSGNPNEVVLTWRRTSDNYFDTLIDDAHVYTYGIDLTKQFSDGRGDFANVEFLLHNDTDGYYIQAERNDAESVYYMTGHAEAEADATHFIPTASGRILVKGLEDDAYTITEVRTDNGYTLLKEDIEVVISQVETTEFCDIYTEDVVGLIQNDPRYAEVMAQLTTTGKLADALNNIPQTHLEHHLLTASAAVDGNAVTMLEDNGSQNAEAPLTVVNTRGFDLPKTGDTGTWIYPVLGLGLIAAAWLVVLAVSHGKKKAK